MNETFENALDIASNVAGHSAIKGHSFMDFTALTYYPDAEKFTAYFADNKGHSWVDMRNIDINILIAELKEHYELDNP